MTTTVLTPSDHDAARRALLPVAGVVTISTVALTVYGAHRLTEVVVVLAIAAVVMAAVYGFVLPRLLRRDNVGGTALALSVVALVLILPAFWSGLPLVLGAAGALLGYAGRNAATGSGKATAGLVIGLLAAIGYYAAYVLDTLNQAGVS
jgi:hypothetical protein